MLIDVPRQYLLVARVQTFLAKIWIYVLMMVQHIV